jgi:hypothetical protein
LAMASSPKTAPVLLYTGGAGLFCSLVRAGQGACRVERPEMRPATFLVAGRFPPEFLSGGLLCIDFTPP